MRFAFVVLVVSFVLSHGFYAAPIDEIAAKSLITPRGNEISTPFTNQVSKLGRSSIVDDDERDNQEYSSHNQLDHPNYASFASKVQPFKCGWQNCNLSFDVMTEFINYVNDHHMNPPFECHWKNCNYLCVERSFMKRHLRTHTEERPFVCPNEDCRKSFTRYEHLKRHFSTHFSNEKIPCPLLDCDKKYSCLESIRSHLRLHANQSHFSEEDVNSICKALRKDTNYPDEVANRISLKERVPMTTRKLSNSEQVQTYNDAKRQVLLSENEHNNRKRIKISHLIEEPISSPTSSQNIMNRFESPSFHSNQPIYSISNSVPILRPLLLTFDKVKLTLLLNGEPLDYHLAVKIQAARVKVWNDAYVFNFNVPFESIKFVDVKCDKNELRIYLERNDARKEQELYFGAYWNEMVLRADLKWGSCPNKIESTFDTFGQLQVTLPRH